MKGGIIIVTCFLSAFSTRVATDSMGITPDLSFLLALAVGLISGTIVAYIMTER